MANPEEQINVAEMERLAGGARPDGMDCEEAITYLARRVIAVEKLVGTLSYLQTQAENGTLHPQVVIQNARESLQQYEDTR